MTRLNSRTKFGRTREDAGHGARGTGALFTTVDISLANAENFITSEFSSNPVAYGSTFTIMTLSTCYVGMVPQPMFFLHPQYCSDLD